MDEIKVLQQSVVEGFTIKLPPGQLDNKLYLKVKAKLEGIGGKWKGGKVQGFVFREDPFKMLQRLRKGEAINLKKDFQFYPTDQGLADKLVQLAEIYHDDKVLEPSAGLGALIKAVHKIHPEMTVDYCELFPANLLELRQLPGTRKVGDDFLQYNPGEIYDIIIANPPFTRNQDIDHIYHMYKLLRPGGRIVSLSSTHWKIANKPKEIGFKGWIEGKGGTSEDLPGSTFRKSGANASSCIVVLNKPPKNKY